MLVLTRPDVVRRFHAAFLEVGVDVVETNSFGSFSTVLAEYDLSDRAYEISLGAARLARQVADEFATADHPRWVAGSMGPGTKMPTLGHISFAALRDAYETQARALLDGGVDLLMVETQYDLLSAKAGINGARRAMAATGRQVPVQVQVTIEQNGRMLVGSEIGAGLVSLDAVRPDVIGLNCATGPREMTEHLRHLSRHARMPIACLPNAGLPSVVDGRTHYDLTPEELAEHQARFVTELGVTAVGGCCGTMPEHLAAVVERCRNLTPAPRTPVHEPSATSIYSPVPYEQDTSVLLIGERTNTNGSRKFRDALLAGDVDTCVQVGTDQVAESAHLIDLCVDYVGRDGAADMADVAFRFATAITLPIVLDSTEAPVLEAGLQRIGGKCLLNSANLEDGEAPGSRFDRVMSLAREYGAGVICLTIDEQGQARTRQNKLEIATRIRDLAVGRYGIEPEDLFFDCLALTLGTGQEESFGDAVETIEGIRLVKQHLPGVRTVLGLSNVSFGLSPALRHLVNSVFLHECQQAGLDAAILHAGKILPINRLDERARELCLDLVWNRRHEGYDPLQVLLTEFSGMTTSSDSAKEDRSGWPVERRLETRIVDGDRNGLVDDLDEALGAGIAALDIVNQVLLPGMKTVGELFGSGQMQLPFVLQSAETMKAAVAHLEPYMEKVEGQSSKGRVVLATVKGDVHDIGKNLVDIILTNNGYEVHNLGIKVPVHTMVDKAQEVQADVIGMSGLLVKSTLVMRENLLELNERKLADIPVLLGGAALTRTYVERDLRQVYDGRLFYGRDAFEGLRTMERLMAMKRGHEADDPAFGRALGGRNLPPRAAKLTVDPASIPRRAPSVAADNPVFKPPFLGSRVVKGVALDDIAGYLNETALFRNQWGFRPEKSGDAVESDAAMKDRVRAVLRRQLASAKASGVLVPQVVYGYFPANGDGNDVVIWTDESRSEERVRFPFPRQEADPWLCIADFLRPVESGEVDYASFHIVTMGAEVTEAAGRLKAEDRYTDYLFLHGLGVEMTEALAEYWHRRIREEWGFAAEDGPTLTGLFRQKYRGGRYSWGYQACPDLEDNETAARLLEAGRIGIEVSEETGYQFQPEQTTSAIIFHHPQAKYFVA
jgi:5-methyltetrahydrofolate--homocysteine methyltransferase